MLFDMKGTYRSIGSNWFFFEISYVGIGTNKHVFSFSMAHS